MESSAVYINKHKYLPRIAEFHRPLLWCVYLMGFQVVVSVGGLIFDDLVLVGAPAWAKSLKFALSTAIYAITLAALLPMLHKRKRLGWWLGTILAVALVIEQVAIVGQILRRTTSHFNYATPFDTTVWMIMAFTILLLWIATFVVGVLLWRHSIGDRALTWSIRLSMVIALIGLGLGNLMPSPTADQLESSNLDVIGAHSVGVADGGPGLPLLGWSTTGGDLRIPHFVGMHALQVLPLIALGLAWWSIRRSRLAAESTRTRLVVIAAAGYLGLTGLVLWQALRGEPLIHPGATTLLAAGGLFAAVAIATVVTLMNAPASQRTEDTEDPVGISSLS